MDLSIYDLRDIDQLWAWAIEVERKAGWEAAVPILYCIEDLEWQQLDQLTRPDDM